MEESARTQAAYRAVLLAAALLVLGLVFRTIVTLLLAVLITVILAIALASVADRLERRRVPRPIGALAGLLGALAVIATILALIIPPFVDQTNAFAKTIPNATDSLLERAHDLTGAKRGDIARSVERYAQRYTNNPGRLIGPITQVGLGVAGGIAALLLVIVTAYYIAVNPRPLLEGMRRLVAPDHRHRVDRVTARLRTAWVGWMQGVAVDMAISFLLLFIGLSLVGLKFAVFFAVLTALLSVVPYFGAVAGGIPPTLFALTESPGKAALVLAVYVLVQQVEGHLTIPLVMSRTVRLHPALIAIGVVVVGQLFGFVGLIVAVPILSMFLILAEELWVLPMEERARRRRAEGIDVPADPDRIRA